MKRNIILTGAVLAIMVASCGKKGQDKKAELAELKKEQAALADKISKLETELGTDKENEKVFEVGVQAIEVSDFRSYLEIQGKIDAEQNVGANPQASGMVKAVYARVGQQVKEGQVLAKLDDDFLTQSISELQTQLDLANTLFQRQKNLWEQKIGTEVQYLNAKTQKEALDRKLSTLKTQKDFYLIKAPITGTVDVMDLRVGQMLQPGMPGIKVVNHNNLKVKALVTDAYAGRVKSGNRVVVELPDLKKHFESNLSYMSQSIDPVSRCFAVEVKLPSNSEYKANMVAILRILDYQNARALVLPVAAVQKSEKGSFVFVAQGNVAKKVDVSLGKIYRGQAEILSGLKAGDKVIVSGASDVNEGDSIKY